PYFQLAKLTASDGVPFERVGYSVSVSADGSAVVAGAPQATIGSNGGQGAAYVLIKGFAGWANETQIAKLTASDGASQDSRGFSVSVSADASTVVAGAPRATACCGFGTGAAYVFLAPFAGNQNEAAKLTASDGAFP